jgi:uncharacterized protein
MPRYLGNAGTTQFHDLTRERAQCQIARIRSGGRDRYFTPDTAYQALREGFEPCWFCIGTVMDLLLGTLGGPVETPGDLSGEDLGGGVAALRWTYSGDPSLLHVEFDVYSSGDPLDPFRTVRLAGHPSTSATLPSLPPGTHYFTVVARRGSALSLPSRPLALGLRLVEHAAIEPRTDGGRTKGLGFPFGIDGRGGIHEQQGDPLLHGKILQLLLTAPGERVNRPDYGTRLHDLVFDPANEILAATTEFSVMRALQRFLGDQVQVEGVSVRSDENALHVEVAYVRRVDLRREQFRTTVPFPGQ